MEDLARLDACCPKGPDYLSAQLGQVVTPLCWQAWDQALRGHPDNQFRRYIVKGIREGFRVGCTRSRTSSLETLAVVNSGYSRVTRIMHLLRCLFFIRALFQIEVWAVHTPGRLNCKADAISRNNLHFLFSQAPDSRTRRVPIPPALTSLLVKQMPDWTSQAWAELFKNCFQLA